MTQTPPPTHHPSSGSSEVIDPMVRPQLKTPALGRPFALIAVATTLAVGWLTSATSFTTMPARLAAGALTVVVAMGLHPIVRRWSPLLTLPLAARAVVRYGAPHDEVVQALLIMGITFVGGLVIWLQSRDEES